MKLAVIGAGQRGMVYASYAYEEGKAEIAAVVEPIEEKREIARQKFRVPKERCFADSEDFWKAGKLADAVIIATQDQDHYRQAIAAIDAGYDILLEKPVSPSAQECLDIQKRAEEAGVTVTVCHVLRYTNFFSGIKEIVDSGRLGKVITIQHAENIGNYHFAHSFVRGNWRDSNSSSPIILAKSCHDMDILVWLAESNAKKVSSFGSLSYFKEENAPEGSTDRCLTCPAAESCRYDARKAYLPVAGQWPATVVSVDQSEKGILEALREGPYGRCVYRCDNNVCDHQVTVIEFENGVTATFHMTAFSGKIHRTIKVMCEKGNIYGDESDNELIVTQYPSNGQDAYVSEEIHLAKSVSGHGGGDFGLMGDFLKLMGKEDGAAESRSSISRSVESHLMAFAAEKSRITGSVIMMDEFRKELEK